MLWWNIPSINFNKKRQVVFKEWYFEVIWDSCDNQRDIIYWKYLHYVQLLELPQYSLTWCSCPAFCDNRHPQHCIFPIFMVWAWDLEDLKRCRTESSKLSHTSIFVHSRLARNTRDKKVDYSWRTFAEVCTTAANINQINVNKLDNYCIWRLDHIT